MAFLVLSGVHCSSGPPVGFSVDAGDGDAHRISLVEAGISLGGDANDGKAGPPVNLCKVGSDDNGAVPVCTMHAPPNSFSAEVKWTWTAPVVAGSQIQGSVVTPLVGHFVDTNHDGAVDLCDTPSIVVAAGFGDLTATNFETTGSLFLLAGDSGEMQAEFPTPIDTSVTPAFADIDGDGYSEIVTADTAGHLIAFAHDGTVKWTSSVVGGWFNVLSSYCHAIAIYDLDGDGTPEILAAFEVYDNHGNLKFGVPGNGSEYANDVYWCPTPTAADLDGDGKLEVIFGRDVYRSDGTLMWSTNEDPGQPHVADFDGDGKPDIIITNDKGIAFYQANGTKVWGPVEPTQQIVGAHCWGKPGVIHDFNGDGKPEFATGSCTDYSVYEISAVGPKPLWTASVSDLSGLATGTGFDFLGRGYADAIYADETLAYAFNGRTGAREMTTPRQSGTLIEYPVVADVDNDGSADFVVVSNAESTSPVVTVTVYQDALKRWIPARRVWNQHAYHVTNVREDGTIPMAIEKSWTELNTFRANSQIESGMNCQPSPPPK
jgi:hypothetical protein